MVIVLVRFQPESDETWIFVCDHGLCAEELPLVPVDDAFEFAILVQWMDDETIVVQIDSTVLHENADAPDVTAVEKSPTFAQFLAENFRWSFEIFHFNAGPEILLVLNPFPVLSFERHILDVGVIIEFVRPVVAHRRFQHDVIDKIELKFLKADEMDYVGNDETIGTSFIIEIIRECVDSD